MAEEKLKIWLGFARFFLGSVVVAIVTLLVNHEIQEREIEVKEQELIGKFLEPALTENVGVRRRFAQYFSTVTRSNTLRARWKVYRDEVEEEFAETQKELNDVEKKIQELAKEILPSAELGGEAIVLEQKVARAEELRAELQPKPIPQESILPSRVYFHIKAETQRKDAQELAGKLASAMGVRVPGVQRIEQAPKTSELRYFKASEVAEAREIAEFMKRNGLPVEPKYIPGYESSSRLRPRHYELWISEGAFQ